MLIQGGQFIGYTYVLPATESLSPMDAGGLALLLLVYGARSNRCRAGRRPRTPPRVDPLPRDSRRWNGRRGTHRRHFAGLFVAVALSGFGYGGATPAAQTWAAKAAPDHLEQVGGLAVVTFQSGIALGAIVGGLLVDGIAPTAPLVVGAIVAVIGGILLTSLRLRPATS
nr:MFS transporter [Microbacterium marinum]